MSVSDNQQIKVIYEYLLSLNDTRLNEKLSDQNMFRCYNYVLTQVLIQANQGFAMVSDDKVYSMARHFFDETMYLDNSWDVDVLDKYQTKQQKPKADVEKHKIVKVKKNETKDFEEITIFDI
ncbi:MAG: Cas9 inhibitor AcrIIA9 family protein [Anaerorhabdus sp.]|uniref:Cas9 inhibitor AcrIIA9 family protein n=1 Tax=Anaerorhabdus sp. TaxID=1872524 RepID=UPI002FCBCBC7